MESTTFSINKVLFFAAICQQVVTQPVASSCKLLVENTSASQKVMCFDPAEEQFVENKYDRLQKCGLHQQKTQKRCSVMKTLLDLIGDI